LADTKPTQVIPVLPMGLSPEQRARYEEIAALARATADRLPRPMEKTLEPAPIFSLQGDRRPLS
jgi:hypothetical protein